MVKHARAQQIMQKRLAGADDYRQDPIAIGTQPVEGFTKGSLKKRSCFKSQKSGPREDDDIMAKNMAGSTVISAINS